LIEGGISLPDIVLLSMLPRRGRGAPNLSFDSGAMKKIMFQYEDEKSS
jgi:hypothetical protein